MDPNENIEQQRTLVCRIIAARDRGEEPDAADATALADLVVELDGWVMRGGALPDDWRQPCGACSAERRDGIVRVRGHAGCGRAA
jgi:hypothetical protein